MWKKRELVELLGEIAELMAKVENWQESDGSDFMPSVALAGLRTAYRVVTKKIEEAEAVQAAEESKKEED
jgi:hypothetical protein